MQLMWVLWMPRRAAVSNHIRRHLHQYTVEVSLPRSWCPDAGDTEYISAFPSMIHWRSPIS